MKALRISLLAMLPVLGLAIPVAAQQPSVALGTPEVVELRFDGARSFLRDELAAAIVTTATRCPNALYQVVCWAGIGLEPAYLVPGAPQADALRLRVYYHDRGFRDAEVSSEILPLEDGKVAVIFRITENLPVRVTEVEVSGVPEDLPAGNLPLQVGAPFDMVAYEAGRDTLLARLRNHGHAHAQVLLGADILFETPLEAAVRYQAVPGPRARFGEIRVEGMEKASPALVRRMLTFDVGHIYDRSRLLDSQRNLYGLQIFRHAEVQADLQAGPDTLVPVIVRVAEGNMRRVRLGGGVSNVECVNFEGRWTSRNFMGGGRRLDLRGRLGNLLPGPCEQLPGSIEDPFRGLTGLLSADFTQPWFFGPKNNVGAGMFTERRSVPDVFVRTAVGGYTSLSRSLGPKSAITLGYRPELTELELTNEGDLFFCVNFVACAFEEISVLQDPHWLSPLTLTYSVDRSDDLFTPSSGFIVRADLEHADEYTASDFAYTRLHAEASAYNGKAGGVILAARLRGGIGWPHRDGETGSLGLNPQKRFFAGGPNSVRGLPQYRLGPKVLSINATRWLAPEDDTSSASPRVDGAGCTMQAINDGSCDAGVFMLPGLERPGVFDSRPAGGEVMLEGNLELRYPLPLWSGKLRGAAFLDAGQVWRTSDVVGLSEIVITPGLGVRYHSPIGPIRIDVGYNTQGAESLPVLTTRVETCVRGEPGCRKFDWMRDEGEVAFLRNTDTIVPLTGNVMYDPYGDFFDRLQLHFSIGQAF